MTVIRIPSASVPAQVFRDHRGNVSADTVSMPVDDSPVGTSSLSPVRSIINLPSLLQTC